MSVYYEDDLVTLYLDDCLDVLPTLSGVDAVITSPPYNLGEGPWEHLGNWKRGGKQAGGKGLWKGGPDSALGVEYGTHDDTMPHDEYVAWQRAVLAGCWESLSDIGAIFYNHKPRVIGTRLWLPTELNPDLPLRQIVIWSRGSGMNFSPVAYMPTHEWVMIFAKTEWRLKSRGASGVGDVWGISPATGNSHPAPFPLSLPAQIIETAAPRLVLDPFAGSGTTLRAAKDAGVRCIGIEKNEAYCEMAVKRLGQEAFNFEDIPA